MRGKYIDTNILMACRSQKIAVKEDIHAQLKETIAEHKKIREQFNLFIEMLYSSNAGTKEAVGTIPQELLKINHLS